MKTEDIDKKIGMPDIDEEWAKFQREVIGEDDNTIIGKETKPRKRVLWGWTAGIAASIALAAGIFLWGNGAEEPTDSSGVVAQATNTQTEVKNHIANDDETQKETTDNSQSDAVAEDSRTDDPTSNLIAMGTPRSNDKVANPQSKDRVTNPLSDNRVGTPPSNDNQEAQTPATDNKTDEKVFSVVEQQPFFRGGNTALQEFIKQNLRYPPAAQEYGVSGSVIMQFMIDSLGYVSDAKAVRYYLQYDTLLLNRESEARQIQLKEHIAQQMEEECARIIAMMPRWTPKKIHGKVMNTKYNVPFLFKLQGREEQEPHNEKKKGKNN